MDSASIPLLLIVYNFGWLKLYIFHKVVFTC